MSKTGLRFERSPPKDGKTAEGKPHLKKTKSSDSKRRNTSQKIEVHTKESKDIVKTREKKPFQSRSPTNINVVRKLELDTKDNQKTSSHHNGKNEKEKKGVNMNENHHSHNPKTDTTPPIGKKSNKLKESINKDKETSKTPTAVKKDLNNKGKQTADQNKLTEKPRLKNTSTEIKSIEININQQEEIKDQLEDQGDSQEKTEKKENLDIAKISADIEEDKNEKKDLEVKAELNN